MAQAVQYTGKTVVVLLPDTNFAASHADRIIAMKDGRLYGEGLPEMVEPPATATSQDSPP